ncbi:OmpA family protein [Desulforhopalus sp. IMCC35007]|uniref:OmpA family protein n=1 Tax=Desulforhopalus sp. IMCC35007 TaxID=2569543 RepID=UPI0010AEBE95|nr:OmpA family protein [Desulforhopalus sp. IMCC35007]TKB10237.1 peptidoglycan-associated lipoprotein [Desulforhopalus sp. IMCC35007]
MTKTNIINTLLCCVLATSLLSGCGKKSVSSDEISQSRKPEGRLIGDGASQSIEETDGNFGMGELESLDRTGTPLSADNMSEEHKRKYGRSTGPLMPIYFAFDSSSINSTQFDNLGSNGRYLLEKKSPRLVIEGNCDQRGTADYNLALGELRAISVKKYLANLGVDPAQMTTTSYGSQRPLFLGSDEESMAGNRRVDLILP